MTDRFVRITLEAPFVTAAGDQRDEVSFRYGTEPATLASGGYVQDVGLGADAVPVSQRAGAPPKFIPGKPIIYTLKWSNPEFRSAVVPTEAAVNYFGDWTIQPGSFNPEDSTERSFPMEKKRIESVWGGLPREPRKLDVPGHYKSLRAIGPPAVPRVVIHQLDSMMRLVAGFEYRPWEHFSWDQHHYAVMDQVPAPTHLVMPNGAAITPEMQSMLEQLVQQQVEMRLADAKPHRKAI